MGTGKCDGVEVLTLRSIGVEGGVGSMTSCSVVCKNEDGLVGDGEKKEVNGTACADMDDGGDATNVSAQLVL